MAVSTDWNLKEPHTLADTRADEPTNTYVKKVGVASLSLQK